MVCVSGAHCFKHTKFGISKCLALTMNLPEVASDVYFIFCVRGLSSLIDLLHCDGFCRFTEMPHFQAKALCQRRLRWQIYLTTVSVVASTSL